MAKMLASDYAKTDAAMKAEAAAKAYRDRLNGTPKPQPAPSTTPVQPAATGTTQSGTTTGLPGSNFNVNDYLSQYKDSITKPVTPFQYDIKSIKSDPLYTSALASFSKDTERGTNQSLVNLGRRGIGNSQSAVTAELAGQQSVNDYANTKLAPSVIAQKYQQYLDTNTQQDKQNQNILGFAKTVNDLGQQGFNNNILTNQDNRAQQAQDANFTGYYRNPNIDAIQKQIADNGKAWFGASPDEQQRLHDENLRLAESIGATGDGVTQDYAFNPRQRTIQGQTFDFNKEADQRDFQYKQARDAIADEQYKLKFDEDVRRYGIDSALQRAVQFGQLSISQQNANTSAASAANSNANAKERLAFDKEQAAKKTDNPIPTKNDLESQYISGFESLTPAKRVEALKAEKANIVKDIGIAGYNTIYNMYVDSDGIPK